VDENKKNELFPYKTGGWYLLLREKRKIRCLFAFFWYDNTSGKKHISEEQ